MSNILTFGITDLDAYPSHYHKNPSCCKEFVEVDELYIPCQKPDIEDIDSIHVNICIENFKIIKTIQGYKLIVEGIKKLKVMYTADTCNQSVHTAHWESHFCQFILLQKNITSINYSIHDIFIGVEDIVVKVNDLRSISVWIFLILCPTLNISSNCTTNNPSKCTCTSFNNNACKENIIDKKNIVDICKDKDFVDKDFIDKNLFEHKYFNKTVYKRALYNEDE